MEKFAVDLDKVLDEFELNEDRADEIAAGKESHPSGYQEYLNSTRENIYSFHDCAPLVPSLNSDRGKDEGFAASSLRYDVPYEPTEKINLIEADFAPKCSLSAGGSSSDKKFHNCLDPTVSNEIFQCSNFIQEPKPNSIFANKNFESKEEDLLSSDYLQYPSTSQTLSSLATYNSKNEVTYTPNSFLSSFSSCTVVNKNKMETVSNNSDKKESECSADRLMKDIETVMETGLSLSTLKYNNQSQEFHASGKLDFVPGMIINNEPNKDFIHVNNVPFSETYVDDLHLENPVPLDSIELPCEHSTVDNDKCSTIKDVSAKQTHSGNSFSDSDSNNHSLSLHKLPANHHVSSLLGKKVTKVMINGSEDNSPSEDIESSDQNSLHFNDDETEDTSTSVLENLHEAAKSKLVESTEMNRDTETTVPKEVVLDQEPVLESNEKSSKIVGFSCDVDICDSELEKYLKEAEDNEKLEISQKVLPNLVDKTRSVIDVENTPAELSAEMFASVEEYCTPLLESTASNVEASVINTSLAEGTQQIKFNSSLDISSKASVDKNGSASLPTEHDASLESNILNEDAILSSNTVSSLLYSNTGARPKCTDDTENSVVIPEKDVISDEPVSQTSLPPTVSTENVNMIHKDNEEWTDRRILHDAINRELAQRTKLPEIHLVKEQQNLEIRNQLQMGTYKNKVIGAGELTTTNVSETKYSSQGLEEISPVTQPEQYINMWSCKTNDEIANLNNSHKILLDEESLTMDDSEEKTLVTLKDTSAFNKRQRPTSLNLSGKSLLPAEEGGLAIDVVEEPNFARQNEVSEDIPIAPVEEETRVGHMAPFWIPDAEAPNCMQCNTKFTVIKRRHHCRACGRVLCSQCCASKAKLPYMENKEARVCQQCLQTLNKVQAVEHWNPISSPTTGSLNNSPLTPLNRSPNPNNPNEYCSTIPPLQQVQANANAPPPTVMVPVGVLKREGVKTRGEPKQVMFSDGIRPGGDLTELDVPADSKPLHRRQKRIQRKIEKVSEYLVEDNPDNDELYSNLEDPQLPPIVFAVNKNLMIHVKITSLDCCIKKTCWCFTTEGMATVGQEELVIILECLPEERTIPRDIFSYFSLVYDEANQGNSVGCWDHTVFTQSFLGSREHGGFLYIRPTFQCLNKLFLPPHPYLVGILLQKWEIPWAKIFPLRLMLRFGYEFRFYPCPLISIRHRKPVYSEIGHTIMNLLADFRNYQYKLATLKGMVIHMEEKITHINIPKNRYDEAMKALNNSNDHVLALGGNFSMEADSHLVCIQNEDGNYQTQAINIENKTRKVTGASFVVFNGALKSSTGLSAKSSIVEDGLMVQILPDTMIALRQNLRDMQDFTIGCGPQDSDNPEEIVSVCWTEDDKQVNVGVRSPIDGMQMDGIPSIHIHGGTDYMDERWLIRWTEVFFIQTDDNVNIRRSEPVNMSRLAEILAQACCIALTAHLNSLKETSLTKIGLRVNIDAENVGYEIGSRENKLPSIYMNDLDSELVPVIHRAASQTQEGPITLELVFHIMEQ